MILNALRASRTLLAGAALLLPLSAAIVHAQAAHETALDRQLDRIDLGIMGEGEFTTSATGLNFSGTTATQTPVQVTAKPSNTVGVLATLRYTGTRWFGLEVNYGYVRYTEAFSYLGLTPQTNADEYSVGYVVHPGSLFGLETFASAGSGSIAFRPTTGGGLNFPPQARQVYYYDAGVEKTILGTGFGIRAAFRQSYYLAPDFEENYFRIKKHVFTTEPIIGFYYHF